MIGELDSVNDGQTGQVVATGDQGSAVCARRGCHPQEIPSQTPGVSSVSTLSPDLSPAESSFIEAVFRVVKGVAENQKEMYSLGKACELRPLDVRYIREWVICHGVHWMACEKAGVEDNAEGRKVFRNPVVRRVINALSEMGVCQATVATKEEVADYFTQRMRSPYLPEPVKDNAAHRLAQLMGYYPENGGKGSVEANVQINFVNPYGGGN
jgi:hypothetical protein